MSCHKNAGGCGHEFCWLCRGPWTEHGSSTGGYYACNKYESSEAKNDDMKVIDVKTELELYMFYYHRYQSHQSARKVAIEQKKKLFFCSLGSLCGFPRVDWSVYLVIWID
jgi:ariadne-1